MVNLLRFILTSKTLPLVLFDWHLLLGLHLRILLFLILNILCFSFIIFLLEWAILIKLVFIMLLISLHDFQMIKLCIEALGISLNGILCGSRIFYCFLEFFREIRFMNGIWVLWLSWFSLVETEFLHGKKYGKKFIYKLIKLSGLI